jgi:exportin-T
LDDDTFRTLQQSFMSYIQAEFVHGSAEAGAPCVYSFLSYTFSFPKLTLHLVLRNKFSHTLTLFFLCTYMYQWSTFFADLFTLIYPAESTTQQAFNRHVSLLFFHVVLEISGEVADQIIKSARQYNPVRQTRDGRVRDMVREQDAARINDAVLTIVADGSEKMTTLRKSEHSLDWARELDGVIEVVDYGIRTFGSYVGAFFHC